MNAAGRAAISLALAVIALVMTPQAFAEISVPACSRIVGTNASAVVVELRKTPLTPGPTTSLWRSTSHWLIPDSAVTTIASNASVAALPQTASSCERDGIAYWAIESDSPWLQYDDKLGIALLRDPASALTVDGRTRIVAGTERRIASIGVNQQVAARYSGSGLRWSGQSEFYAWRDDWFLQSGLGVSSGDSVRYETFALHEDQGSSIALRLGDGASLPTALGESVRYAGIGWGVDRTLQPGDFGPVLPNLRGSDVMSGPVELYVNDQLQFQQNLDGSAYDLRNMPVQRGFNTYRVRTLDAQGNYVQVNRELYVPQNLLPKDALAWRVDAGVQRKRFGEASFKYGNAVTAGYVAWGATEDTTLTAQILTVSDSYTASLEWDQRLNANVGGQLALVMSRSIGEGSLIKAGVRESGTGARIRLEGGTSSMRFFTELIRSPGGLPSLTGVLGPLTSQSLVTASWTGLRNWSFSASAVQRTRVTVQGEQTEKLATLSASLSPGAAGFPILFSYTELRAGTEGLHRQLSVSAFVPLEGMTRSRSRSLYGNVTSADHARIVRTQYSEADATGGSGPSWTVGADHDTRMKQNGIDGQYFQQLQSAEVLATARTTGHYNDASLSVRSGLLYAGDSLFVTRPITGAFALVSTGQEGIPVLHENRVAGTTNAKGLALVPGLRAFEQNKISLDPTDWPMDMTVRDTQHLVVPPRGGGVFVSFVVNANIWPADTMVRLQPRQGGNFPEGTAVWASDAPQRTTVVDSNGLIWLGDLLPTHSVTVRRGGELCEYALPLPETGTSVAEVVACRNAP